MNSESASLKVYQAVARALFDNGIDTMFGVMGDANMFMADSFMKECGGNYVAAAHEAGAALMALGYAYRSGNIGVCTTTQGPGLANAILALIDGVRASLPMVLVCGDTTQANRDSLQNLPHRDLVMATGAGFEQLRTAKTAAQDVATALRRAMVERRPIVLNIPTDIQWGATKYEPSRYYVAVHRPTVVSSDDMDNAIGIIAAARRPIVLVGRGGSSTEGRAAAIRLAERIQAPLATTLKAKDLFRGEDFNLGIFGTLSNPEAVEIILQSDCVIAVGTGLNRHTTSSSKFIEGKRLIQIDLDVTAIGKFVTPNAGLVGDPASIMESMIGWLDAAEIEGSGWRTEELKQQIARDCPPPATTPDGEGTIDFRRALARVNELAPANRLLVTDGGRFMRETWTRIETDGPRSFVFTINTGSIGLGLSYAIGAAAAAEGQPVLIVTGDGGFMNGGLAEFNTAVRYNLDLIVVVCNDGAYGAEHISFINKDVNPDSVTFVWPEFAPLALALGGEGVTVREDGDWDTVAVAIANRKGPLLVDVKLDPNLMST